MSRTAYQRAYYLANREEKLARKKARRLEDVEAARAYERAANKKHYAANKDRILAKRYGISAEQYAEMVSRQVGRCAVCGDAPTDQGLCIDHNHASGAVRGLLCARCNCGLGQFLDDPARLRAAAEYVEKHQTARFLPLGSPTTVLETQGCVGNFNER